MKTRTKRAGAAMTTTTTTTMTKMSSPSGARAQKLQRDASLPSRWASREKSREESKQAASDAATSNTKLLTIVVLCRRLQKKSSLSLLQITHRLSCRRGFRAGSVSIAQIGFIT